MGNSTTSISLKETRLTSFSLGESSLRVEELSDLEEEDEREANDGGIDDEEDLPNFFSRSVAMVFVAATVTVCLQC